MSTAQKILDRAFTKNGIRAAETPLTPSEISDGLDVLNDLLASWDSTGVLKGITPVMDVSEDLMEPRYSTWAIKTHVAAILAGEYGVQVTQALAADVVNSMNSMLSASINLQDLEFPSTLPIGSGNRNLYGEGFDRDFFREDQKRNF